MQTQTIGRRFGTIPKLAGGLLVAVIVVAGVIGLAPAGTLDISGIGSSNESVAARAIYHQASPFHGEGLPRSQVVTTEVARPASLEVQEHGPGNPRGEGFPRNIVESKQGVSPLGEGLMKSSR